MISEYHFRFYKMLGKRFGRLTGPQVETVLEFLKTSKLMPDVKSSEGRRFGVVDCGLLQQGVLYGNFVLEYIRETLSFNEYKQEAFVETRGFEKYAFVVLLDEGVILVQYRKIPGSSWDSVQKNLKQLIDWGIACLEWGTSAYRYSQGTLGGTRTEVLEAFSRYEVLEVKAEGFDLQGLAQTPGGDLILDSQDGPCEPWRTETLRALRDLECVTVRSKKDADLGKNALAKALVYEAKNPRITYRVENEQVQVGAEDEDCLDVEILSTPDDGEPELQEIAMMALRRYRSVSSQIIWDRDDALTLAP